MPSNSYHCKYCHQRKLTETALNQHIAHSSVCFQAWQDDLVRLTSTNNAVDGGINRRPATMEDLRLQETLINDSKVQVEVSIPDQTGPAVQKLQASSIRHSEETDDDEDVNDKAHSQIQYRKGYPVGYAAEILGEGKTKFQIWQEERSLDGENEWAPFQNQKEWDLAQWLIRNVGQKSMDEFLKLPFTSICMHIQSIITTNLLSDSRPC